MKIREDDGRYDRTVEYLRSLREDEEKNRFRAGLRAARLPRRYGHKSIEELAKGSGYGRSTLYEYIGVTSFQLQFCQAVDGSYFSARRIIEAHPMLTYSHFRRAMTHPDIRRRT